jgi:GntR family transcriptional regulator/MocR family aminotransferase
MLDFLVQLSGRRDLRGQIYKQMRMAILEGRSAGGSALPSTRDLARHLKVSRSTVVEAYERLINEGLAVGRIGSATYVLQDIGASEGRRSKRPIAPSIRVRTVWQCASPLRPSKSYRYDFQIGALDSGLFPTDAWNRISRRQLRALARVPNCYGPAAGEPELRGEIAKHVALARAVLCDADDIVVTNGAQQALDLIARVLVEPGATIAMEEPGYLPARKLFESFGAIIAGVPVDREGMIVERLPETARLVYVTPSHQFPLGVPLSLSRRRKLIQWAVERRAAIIEDDYDSDFRFEGRPIESLQSMDRAGVVLYVGTFSKVLLPSLRLGFAVAPPPLREAIIAAKSLSDWQSALLPQRVVAEFMASGAYVKHIRKLTREFARRRHLMLTTLQDRCGAWMRPFPSVAGLHIAAQLLRGVRSKTVVEFAAKQNVGLYDVGPFWAGKPRFQAVMLGFGATPLETLASGVRRLGRFAP